MMYRDHSMRAATRNTKLAKELPKYRLLKEKREIQKLESIQSRRRMAEHYASKYNCFCTEQDVERFTEQ